MSRQYAATVGALIEARTSRHDLKGTPLAALPEFGRKLRAAANRKRTSGDPIALWTVERTEAPAGFRYLTLFTHPLVPESFLTTDELTAVREVTLALATALLARKGAKRLDHAAVERWFQAWDEPATSDLEPPDERWMRRLKRRTGEEDALRATPVRRVPMFLRRLLAPPKKYR